MPSRPVLLPAVAAARTRPLVRVLIDGPFDVGEIADRVGVSQYNASKHLRVLREAGLLQVQKDGCRHLYALRGGSGRRIAESRVLDLGCCSFQFDAEAERPARRAARHRR